MEIPAEAKTLSEKHDFEIQGYKFRAPEEELRSPRVVRIAGIQSKTPLPTTASLKDQRDAIHNKIAKIIEAAHHCGVNIVCMQELWRKYCFYISSILSYITLGLEYLNFCYLFNLNIFSGVFN